MAAKKAKALKIDDTITVDVSELFSPTGKGTRRYNPDDLVRKRGLAIYSTMLNDEQVKAVTEFKSAAVIARGYEFCWPKWCKLSDEEKQARLRVYEQTLDELEDITFEDALDGVCSGFDYGYSVSEKVRGDLEVDGKTYKTVRKILVRDPRSFEFETDDGGKVTKCSQKVSGKLIEIDLESIIRYVHRPKWDYVFGRSDIKEAYRAWYAKDQIIKLWLLYVEKFGGGVTIVSRDENSPNNGTTEFTKLADAVDKISSGRTLILPKGVTATIEFPPSGDIHQKAAEYFDLSIAKAVLVPNLLGLSHTGQTGAYSQSETQLKVFFWTLGKNAKRLEAVLNQQLFKSIGSENWDDGQYPLFRFKKATPEHIKWVCDTYLALVKENAVKPTEDDERHFREALELPERTEESVLQTNPQEEAQKIIDEQRGQDAIKQAQNDAKAAIDAKKLSETQTERIVSAVTDAAHQLANVERPAITVQSLPSAAVVDHPTKAAAAQSDAHPDGKIVPHGKLKYASEQAFAKATHRVAFAVMERNVDGSMDAAVNRFADLMARATSRALGDDSELTLLVDSDPSDIAHVSFAGTDVAKLKAASTDALSQGWKIGQSHAQSELDRAREQPLNSESFTAKFARLEDKAAAYFDNKAFRMAGDLSDRGKKIIQTQLSNAVKSGKPLPEVRAAIWDALVIDGLTTREKVMGIETDETVLDVLGVLWAKEAAPEAAKYLNTLVRTNVFEALNEARYQEFTDPALGDFVEAFEFAAVMDSSTTEVCSHMDGKVFAKDSPEWDRYVPPLHFNCRSVLVPITAIDNWDGKESEKPTVSPAQGFE